ARRGARGDPAHRGRGRARTGRHAHRRAARRDHHGLEVRLGHDAEGRRRPRGGRRPLRDAGHVRPPGAGRGRRLLPQRADARPAGDHRGRRAVRRAPGRRRRPHRAAGHRRPADLLAERRGRPGRDPVRRADASGGARRCRRPGQPEERGAAGPADHRGV
ncbi:MAG: N5-carboxyaminoimidazole ribonucleotide mutase, partial [uncultured Solirubrobacteraceae bacterium]